MAFALLTPAAAYAEPTQPSYGATFDSSALINRPHTVAELEAGVIALPFAPISVANQGGSTPLGKFGTGDATLQTGIHLLYRANRNWAFGAGGMFAPRPTSDSNYQSTGQIDGIAREHSRSYMFLGAEGRYFPLRYRWFEAWVGLDTGVVVVADRFSTKGAAVPTILGTREYTVRTEGFALGVQAGANYMITDTWVVGLTVRLDRWILPNAASDPARDPACSSIGDCPTLSGAVEAFEFGLTVGYRIPL